VAGREWDVLHNCSSRWCIGIYSTHNKHIDLLHCSHYDVCFMLKKLYEPFKSKRNTNSLGLTAEDWVTVGEGAYTNEAKRVQKQKQPREESERQEGKRTRERKY